MKGYVVLAGLALLAAASARPKRRERVLNPLDQEKENNALPPAHVGRDQFEWPLRERFADPIAFQRAYAELGYEVEIDGNVLSDETRAVTQAFQVDWNVVTQAFDVGAQVEPTGYIDVETVHAIAGALDGQNGQNTSWFNIVGEALDRLRPEVG